MANVYNESVAEVAFLFENNVDASTAHNVMNFRFGDVMTAGALDDLATALESWVDVEWQPLGSIVWKCTGLRIRQLKEVAPLTKDVAFSYTGAIVGAAPANNVTIALSFRTGFGGRSYRGRAYHVGLSEADIADSYIDPTVLASLVEGYEAIIELVDNVGWEWVVYSRFFQGNPREVGLATRITNVIAVDQILDSYRTRLPGH